MSYNNQFQTQQIFHQNTVQPQKYDSYPYPSAPPIPIQNPNYQPSSYDNFLSSNAVREQKFQEIVNKHEISRDFAKRLQLLNMFKIVFVFDDSGSMNATLNSSPLKKGLMEVTRWDELEYFAKISIEIASIFNNNGSDIYFLNRPMARNITRHEEIIPYFNSKPNGYTPIARVFQNVLSNNSPVQLGERKLLIILVTDGQPTNDNGQTDINTFKEVLINRPSNTYTTIVSCTDEENTMDYLNNWDRLIPRLDVVDDYRNEKLEVQKKYGRSLIFSFGDYVVKSMIGSIDPKIDKEDEIENEQVDACCNIS